MKIILEEINAFLILFKFGEAGLKFEAQHPASGFHRRTLRREFESRDRPGACSSLEHLAQIAG